MAEQSDADDRLRSAIENQFQSGFTENIENTITDYVFMTVYSLDCSEGHMKKKVCLSVCIGVKRTSILETRNRCPMVVGTWSNLG